MKKETRKYICDSQDLPGWVWITDIVHGFYFLMPRSKAKEQGLIRTGNRDWD